MKHNVTAISLYTFPTHTCVTSFRIEKDYVTLKLYLVLPPTMQDEYDNSRIILVNCFEDRDPYNRANYTNRLFSIKNFDNKLFFLDEITITKEMLLSSSIKQQVLFMAIFDNAASKFQELVNASEFFKEKGLIYNHRHVTHATNHTKNLFIFVNDLNKLTSMEDAHYIVKLHANMTLPSFYCNKKYDLIHVDIMAKHHYDNIILDCPNTIHRHETELPFSFHFENIYNKQPVEFDYDIQIKPSFGNLDSYELTTHGNDVVEKTLSLGNIPNDLNKIQLEVTMDGGNIGFGNKVIKEIAVI